MSKIAVISFVCESMIPLVEMMATRIVASGHEIVDENRAEVVVIASCALSASIKRKCIKRAQLASSSGKRVLMIGCLPEIYEKELLSSVPNASVAGVPSYLKIGEIITKMLEGYRVRRFDDPPRIPVGGGWNRINPLVAYIPISEGCSWNCSFCMCRIARGSLISYPPEKIVSSIINAVENSAKEIVLVGDDVGAYGRDAGMTLPSLLRKVLTIKGDFKVKLSYINPASLLNCFDDLLSCLTHPKMYRFLHLNIQSASNRVLSAMKRKYSAENVAEMVEKLRSSFNGFTILMDVMVGHPAEKDEDFEETVSFLNDVKPDSINVHTYSPVKPEEEVIPSWKVKQRYEELLSLKKKLEQESSKKWIGWSGEVTVVQVSNGMSLGRNYAYRDVLIKRKVEPGTKTNVEVRDFREFLLLT